MDTSVVSQRERTHINDLPFEVLEQIFLLCKGYLFDVMEPSFLPMLLTHVCRLWRNICAVIPSLWSSFRNRSPWKVYSPHPDLVAGWIHRSRNAPLHIDIYYPNKYAPHAKVPLSNLVKSYLVDQAGRWEALAFSEAIDQNFMEDFLSLPADATPSLQAISLLSIVNPRDIFPYAPRLVRKLQELPSLKQFYLDLHGYFSLGELEGLPFERLTHVALKGGWLIDDFAKIFSRCTSALEVSFTTNLVDGAMEPVVPSNVVLSTIKTLTLSTTNLLALTAHLCSFTCPSLRRLHIRITERAPAADTATAIPFLQDFISKSPLEQLIVCCETGDWGSAAEFLENEAVRKIPEVELRLQNQVTGLGRQDCPLEGCNNPHLGWTAHRHQHLGTLVPILDWTPSFWSTHFPHETRTWYDSDRSRFWRNEAFQRLTLR